MEQNNNYPRRRPGPKNNAVRYAIIAVAALLAVAVLAGATVLLSYLTADLSITLQGDSVVTVEYGRPYTEPGVRVDFESFLTKEEGKPLQVDVQGQVSQDNLGEYVLTYSVSYWGHTASAQRTVRIVDTQAPVISLVYNANSFTLPGQHYEEEGFAAEDNYDGNVTDKVERRVEGDTVYYRVMDSSGNTTEVTRQIKYGDFTAPELTLLGDLTITIKAGDRFTDPGYTAIDNAQGDMTDQVVVSKDHSTYIPGTYTITYTVTDNYGNTSNAQRTLIVEATQQPDVVEPNGKVIYLTFDDGPSKHTPKLLETLRKYNVKATFFVVGTANTSYLDDIVADGHAIAIHCSNHDYETIYSSTDAFFSDLLNMQNVIYEKTGVWTTLMRFPGGSSNKVSKKYCPGIMTELTQAVEAQGFQYFDWNVDSNDAGGAETAEEVADNVINGVKKRQYSIVLQHDTQGFSVEAVEQIIAWGLANGYTFLPLDSSSPTAHHPVNN